jgi:hypothetical protein
MEVNSWDEFQPLRELVLGSFYDRSFFEDIKNPRIRDVLVQIADETQEDLENFKEKMKSHNVNVVQYTPEELGYKESILDYVDIYGRLSLHGKSKHSYPLKQNMLPAPPLEPRDNIITMGDKIFVSDPTYASKKFAEALKITYGTESVDDSLFSDEITFRRGYNTLVNRLSMTMKKEDVEKLTEDELNQLSKSNLLTGFCSPNLTRIGSKCLVDIAQTKDAVPFLQKNYSKFQYQELDLGGHNDSIFGVLKPGLVIASKYLQECGQEKVFDRWKVIYFDDPVWDRVDKFRKLRKKNLGKWWVPDQEDNDDFTYFVEYFLENLTGQVDETVFDVNVLVIDDKHVVVNSASKELFKVLRENGMEPIHCPIRHRFFFDGGWHCLTLDTNRKGSQVDYGI